MPTIQDVAKRAKVSLSTASRILSGKSPFSYKEVTRQRVMLASLELGYRPNSVARALASGKTNIVAVVFPRVYDSPFTALFVLEILASIEAYCAEHGYYVLLSSPKLSPVGPEPSYLALLESGYLDGVIIQDDFNLSSALAPLKAKRIPVVCLGHRPHSHTVRTDDFLGGRQLMAHLLELGHRRIGIVGVPNGAHLAVDQRLVGMKEALAQRGLALDELPRADGTFSKESGAQTAYQLLHQHPDLTALACLNDRMAIGAVQQLQALGMRVPQDISVIGYDDLPLASEISPRLTTVNQQAHEWGRLAVAMLLELLQGKPVQSRILPTTLVLRDSTAPPAASKRAS